VNGYSARPVPPSMPSPTARPTARGTERGLTLWLAWLRARPALCAALFYALLSVLMVGPGLVSGRTLSSSDGLWSVAPWANLRPAGVRPLGSNFEMADAVAVFQPFFQFARDAMPGVPLWNPHIMAGRPFLADAQSAIFSPFTVPAYVVPFWKSLAVMAAFKLFVASFGTYVLGRALGMRVGGALLAGVVFAFGTYFIVWLAWPLTNVFPLIPWILLMTELVVRRPGALPAAGLAAVVGLQFLGGHPETSFHVMFATGAFFLFRLGQRWRRDGGGALLRPALVFGGALALGTAIAALTLLPLAEFLFHSGDYQRRLNSEPSSGEAKYLGALLLNDYWGRATQTTIAAFGSNRGYYAGGVTLMLASCALILRPTATRVAIALFALLSLDIALSVTPIADLILNLPGFRTAHNGRLAIFLLFALALLAGWGLDELSSRELPAWPRRRIALGAAVAIFCAPIAWMLIAGTIDLGQTKAALKVAGALRDPPAAVPGVPVAGTATGAIIRLSALFQWLLLAGVGLALIALRLGVVPRVGRPPVTVFAALAVLVLVVDLFRANMGYNPAIPIEHATQPKTEAIAYLQSRRPNRFAGIGAVGSLQALGPDLAMRYGLYDARGYDYPVERRFDRLWRGTAGPDSDIIPPTTLAQPTEASLRTLSLLSVADVIQSPAEKPLELPGLRLISTSGGARVYRNANALPRAFLVDRQHTVDGDAAALDAVRSGTVDTRRVAVTESRLPGLADDSGPAGTAGTAELERYGREDAVVRTSSTGDSLLVLTDVHYPGWKASVDGRDAPIERVNYLLRGVAVPAGRHTVEFRYEPASWRAGWILSLVALAATAGLALFGWRRRHSADPA
jgi:hypothetical protein